jgi:hypothetical protein
LSGWSARRKAATYTGQHKRTINANTHPCLEWDLEPRSQCSSGRRHALDRAATLIGVKWDYTSIIRITKRKHSSFHRQFLNTWWWPMSVETCSAMYRCF